MEPTRATGGVDFPAEGDAWDAERAVDVDVLHD